MRRCSSLSILLVLIGQWLPAYAQVSPPERSNVRYACEATEEISGAEVDSRWCQCLNDYYLDKMTPADWMKYSRDYYALQKLEDVPSEANSYTRHLQVAKSHCIRCKDRNYQGCLKGDERAAQYADIIENLATGQFQSVRKDMVYKLFYTDFVRTYSRQCSSQIREGVVHTFVYDDPVMGTGGSSIAIESEFLGSYERYVKDVELNFLREMGEKIGAALSQQNPAILMDLGLDVVSRDALLGGRFAGKCETPEVRALHANLERFDKGLAPSTGLATSRPPKSAAEQKRAEIIAYTRASYDRAVAAYAPVREKYADLSCPRRQSEATRVTTPRSPGGDDLRDLEGVWSGSFYGEPVELAFWHVQPSPGSNPAAPGILYFADRQCTVSLGISVYGKPAYAVVSGRSNRRHPIDCIAVENTEGGKGGFGFSGDYALKDGRPTLMLTSIQSLLKSNVSCGVNDPAFTRATASASFKKVITDIQAVPDPNRVKPTQAQLEKLLR